MLSPIPGPCGHYRTAATGLCPVCMARPRPGQSPMVARNLAARATQPWVAVAAPMQPKEAPNAR